MFDRLRKQMRSVKAAKVKRTLDSHLHILGVTQGGAPKPEPKSSPDDETDQPDGPAR